MAAYPFMVRHIHSLSADMVFANELVLFLSDYWDSYMVLWDRIMLFLKLKKE